MKIPAYEHRLNKVIEANSDVAALLANDYALLRREVYKLRDIVNSKFNLSLMPGFQLCPKCNGRGAIECDDLKKIDKCDVRNGLKILSVSRP